MKKILIVEDNKDMRELEREIFAMSGYEVSEAGNAQEGIDLAVEQNPDLIILDIRLPSKKRGIGAAKNIRENPKTRDIPIIFVTAYEQGQTSGEIKDIDKCGYITKPFKINELTKMVGEYIG